MEDKKLKLVKYSAAWCKPCKRLSEMLTDPIFNSLEIAEIDVDSVDSSVMVNAGVRGIPTLILVDECNKEVKRISNVASKQHLKDWLDAKI